MSTPTRRKRPPPPICTAISVASLVLAALFLIPLTPNMPRSGLDNSWKYALNIAVAHGRVFGRDLVFTFGPLASAYTQLYSSATDPLMLAVSAVFAMGFVAGAAMMLTPGRLAWAAGLPIILAIAMREAPDSAFLTAPFLLVVVIARTQLAPADRFYLRPTRFIQAGLGLLAIAVAITPLLKGSFVASAGAAYAIAVALLARRHRLAAIALSLLGALTLGLAWIGAGQPLSALPSYFIAQAPIISGYTDAMSIAGPAWMPVLVGAVFLTIILYFYISFGRGRGAIGAAATLCLALVLFVTFKGALVRADSHVTIAAATALLITGVITCRSASLPAVPLWVLVFLTWGGLFGRQPIDLLRAGRLVYAAAADTISGVQTRAFHPDDLAIDFARANAKIRAEEPLPATTGTVDVYPWELSAIFANNLAWNGRPILQSYSVYTPELDRRNADHLERAGADTIFFSFAPIDNRLASLDDSTSLIGLIGRYSVVAYNGMRLQFARHAGPPTAAIAPNPFRSGTARRGEEVQLNETPVWATLDIEPTRLGRLVSALYKLPQLEIEVTLSDGSIHKRRFIAGIGRTGFVVSPFLDQTEDLLALAVGVPVRPRVVSFKIGPGAPWLWQSSYAFQLRHIAITPQVDARPLLPRRDALSAQ